MLFVERGYHHAYGLAHGEFVEQLLAHVEYHVAVVLFEEAHHGRAHRYEFAHLWVHLVDCAVGGGCEVAVFEQGLDFVDAALGGIGYGLCRYLVFALGAGLGK